MKSKTFNISLPKELVEELDLQASKDFSSRSDYIRKAILSQLRTEQAMNMILDRANEKGKALGIESEQQVYDMIDAIC